MVLQNMLDVFSTQFLLDFKFQNLNFQKQSIDNSISLYILRLIKKLLLFLNHTRATDSNFYTKTNFYNIDLDFSNSTNVKMF